MSPPPPSAECPLKLQNFGCKEKIINNVVNVTFFLQDCICLTTLTIHYKKNLLHNITFKKVSQHIFYIMFSNNVTINFIFVVEVKEP
jgi:hypothetical protein